ncbi:peptidase C65 Otubain-domain-containing protein [Podospora didyma]|uniref:ubiquitinyl hydrolase 1 n=1 Tax=Podospora didyma TaxID=330526 RepID=A0AAE0KAK2_9PEZI|nr:peptidase C65 Otubain-domain-containing protein [Podospora didyma]
MFQPQPTAYLVNNGYGVAHSLPQYTFEATPIGLSGGSSSGVGGGGSSGGGGFGGTVAAGTGGPATAVNGSLIYTSPIFSGPASGPFHHFHSNHNTNNSSSSSSSSPSASTSASSTTFNHSSPPPRSVKMEANCDDLAAQEAAAREYQPQLDGPLVGQKTPSTAIAEAYAKADPIYVQKTMALPQTYSHYRPVQGDGNCGWRAIGFGYFEILINRGSKSQVEAEKQRLEGLNSYIETVGNVSAFVFQDMADETIALLDRIAGCIGDREQAMALLTEAFNNPDISNSIVYHFRLLASSWLKGNRDLFSAFITSDMGIEGYSQTTIERHNVEIDHLGLMLLVNVLLKPPGFVLEIAYLDRSIGSQVNTYRFPEEANDQHPSALGPMIHLLYRPDHYDILYPAQMDIQVHRASFSQSYEIASTPLGLHSYGAGTSLLTMIPGFSAPPPGLAPLMDTTTGSPLTSFTPSPVASWMPSPPFSEPPQQAPALTPALAPAAVLAAGLPPLKKVQEHPLRFSEYCQLREYIDNDTWKEPTFQSTSFKNSHFNVAHYQNPNFQPEEYKPGADEFDLPQRPNNRKRGSV